MLEVSQSARSLGINSYDFNAKMGAARAGDRHSGLVFKQVLIGPDAERQLTFDC